jgi:hypothetical protein
MVKNEWKDEADVALIESWLGKNNNTIHRSIAFLNLTNADRT